VDCRDVYSSLLFVLLFVFFRSSHRDLKYENVLFATPDPKSEVKLIDFGLSKMFGNDLLTEGVGTM
jgi:serine/threonine protein kinase